MEVILLLLMGFTLGVCMVCYVIIRWLDKILKRWR